MIKNIRAYNYKGFIVRENDYGLALLLMDTRLNESIDFMKKEGLKGLEVNYTHGYNLDHLDVLKDFNFIEHLRVVNKKIDTYGLRHLTYLKSLELGAENSQEIDFTNFKNLTSCFFSWSKGKESIFSCSNLKKLGIEKFNKKDLQNLKGLINLSYLGIGNSSVECLSGIECLNLEEISLSYNNKLNSIEELKNQKNLKFLELYNLKCLQSLKGIEELPLEVLIIEKCKFLDISEVQDLYNLKKLVINNLGKLSSISPIENLSKLDELFFIEDTNILDGDLTPIISLQSRSLKKFSFMNRKHYSHTREELGWPECLRLRA